MWWLVLRSRSCAPAKENRSARGICAARRDRMRIPLLELVILVVTPVAAQPEQVDTASGALGCFVIASRTHLLADQSAKQLCIGAASLVPASCWGEADNLGVLTD